jgi:FkbM family methyltransferase
MRWKMRVSLGARIAAMDLGLIDRSFQVFAYARGGDIHCRVRRKSEAGKSTRWRKFRIRRGTSDWSTFVQVFVLEDYRLARLARWAELKAIYERIVAEGRRPLIVDCGANIGLSAVYFEECFPKALIVALEPEASNFGVMRRTIGKSSRTICLNAAISSVDGRVEVEDPGLGHCGFRTTPSQSPNAGAGTVESFSFQTVLEKAAAHDKVEPFLAKIDIEGFEKELFASNTGWVDNFPVLVLELHDWMLPGTANSQNFLRTIASLDRDFVYYGENVFSIRNRSV